jgi:hypothetical protein
MDIPSPELAGKRLQENVCRKTPAGFQKLVQQTAPYTCVRWNSSLETPMKFRLSPKDLTLP